MGISGKRAIEGAGTLLFAFCAFTHAQVNVLTANYGNDRTNTNSQEATLTPSNVASGHFGKIGAFPVDGQVYAQPLFVSGLFMPGKGTRNVVFILTQHNSVFAYDADIPSGAGLLWRVNLGPSIPSTVFDQPDSPYEDIAPEIGILSTGVIDAQRQILYVVSGNYGADGVAYRLHALDLMTGSEQLNGPVTIGGGVPGAGADSQDGALAFDPLWHIQRPGLLLANNQLYIACGSHADAGSWHGWLFGYNAGDLSQPPAVVSLSPNGYGASIWQSGRGLASDAGGNVYAITGNGDYDGTTDFGESFLRFGPAGLSVADWYTPSNWQDLANNDYDLSAGPALIHGGQFVVGGDKNGNLYLVKAGLMGGLGGNAQIIVGVQWGGIFNLAIWNQAGGAYVYVQEQSGPLECFQLSGGALAAAPISVSKVITDSAYAGLAVSANGTSGGIVWETTGDHNNPALPGTLHAFDAANLSNELWNSNKNAAADALGKFAKFANPTVVNGRVYVPTWSMAVTVYGLIGPRTRMH